MHDKFKNKFALIMSVIIGLAMFTGCAGNNSGKIESTDNASKIVGTWKRTDREVGMTNTFSANGDYSIKMATSSLAGKYELNGDKLRVYYPDSKAKEMNYRIYKLEGDLLILETENNGEKKYSKLERTAD